MGGDREQIHDPLKLENSNESRPQLGDRTLQL